MPTTAPSEKAEDGGAAWGAAVEGAAEGGEVCRTDGLAEDSMEGKGEGGEEGGGKGRALGLLEGLGVGRMVGG